jgi:DNA-binding transcriptional regulator LsrR (DeoR family)
MQGAHGVMFNLVCGGLYKLDIIRAVLRCILTHVVAMDEATAQALVARSMPSA